MITNKQLALAVNKNLKSKRVKFTRWAIFDGEKQVTPDCYSPQSAWADAVVAICCPFPVGSKVSDKDSGNIYEIHASTFGYPHFYKKENGRIEGSVFRLFRYSDSERFEAIPRANRWYLRDLRDKETGDFAKFWYQHGYGYEVQNFYTFNSREDALKSAGGCGWFEPWYAPYIDSLGKEAIPKKLFSREDEKKMIEMDGMVNE